jgi:hypothetical protein
MTTSSKTPAASTAKAVAKPTAKKTATHAAVKALPKVSAEPSLRFHHSKDLRAKTNAVLDALEARPDHPKHAESVADLVNELIEAGMEYYFLRALKKAQPGFVTEQSARLGISGASKLIGSVSRKFIVRMDQHQLLVVAQHIRELY